ncbi:MAG: hypothetical protein A2506_08465 [Elusimicrobia bacterium RIFOXYD12_FULL_66_9]|nr:MAG: hypothetical protein A2506_08465 [Elusimicrobia bacterium RIFOXYD12_FULL_66_9]
MKKTSSKTSRSRTPGRKGRNDRPLELDRGWQELEHQHDRIKSDWSSLAAQLGIGGRDKPAYG